MTKFEFVEIVAGIRACELKLSKVQKSTLIHMIINSDNNLICHLRQSDIAELVGCTVSLTQSNIRYLRERKFIDYPELSKVHKYYKISLPVEYKSNI